MAMLDFLRRMQKKYGYELQVVHVNHGIRGKEAERDQMLVEKTCKDQGIPCQTYCYDVPGLSVLWKNGLEETGRKVRKEAFCKAIAKTERSGQGRSVIALAHNKNDLAETILHHARAAFHTARSSISWLRSSSRATRAERNAPKVMLSELGIAIAKEEIPKIHKYYPQVEVWRVCILGHFSLS